MATRPGSAERLLFALVVSTVSWAAGCSKDGPTAAPSPLDDARAALDAGAPRRVVAALASLPERTGEALALELVALTELKAWGRVEAARAKLQGAERAVVECVFAAARRDVTADRLCRSRAGQAVASPVLEDAAQRAWARVAEDELRLVEAETRLRELIKARPTLANRKAFVAYLERNGFVAEAVVEVENWMKAEPSDGSLSGKLLGLLERKVRGDLLERRADDALAAARRVLELDPKREAIRYFLADALEMKGDTAGAEREREAAKKAGAKPPPAPDSFPGLEAGPGGAKPAPPGVPGVPGHGHGHGHDHDHEHDH